MASSNAPTQEQVNDAHKTLYAQGLQNRKAVVSPEHVERSLAAATSFSLPMQEFATECAWGWIWSRPGLELKQRSMLNLAMLTALGRSTELGVHVRGAVRNGCSEVEIRETLLQAACYCGMPAGIEGFRVAERVFGEMRDKGELPQGWAEKLN